ncbi:MAG: hypothetical protein AMXMBFR83_07670 [Phycisphaerae bacterium]
MKHYPDAPLYDPDVLRTFFLDFEAPDWEAELADFHNTDVEVPATLTVDGKVYPNVGVHFRGTSSYMTAGEGYKRSLNISTDFIDARQRLYGYKNLNLLNAHEDPTFLRTVLYLDIARRHLPAPKANFVKVVINGESWGLYVNLQQVDKQFIGEWFPSAKGVRWKVPPAFQGGGGLSYLGEDLAAYQRFYEMKSDDGEKAWKELAALCRALEQTPDDKLVETLKPLLNVEGVLWYLALDNALINNDGYWIRASDYNLFRDAQKRFHVIPHDVNEAFKAPGGPGMGRGQRTRGVELDPFAGSDDPNKPLLKRLLGIPALREQYLRNLRTIAAEDLDWSRLGPAVERYQALIAAEVEADTRKLYSTAAFQRGMTEEQPADPPEAQPPGGPADAGPDGFGPPGGGFARPRGPGGMGPGGPRFGPGREMSLKAFAEQRRAYLLNHPDIKKLKP